MAVHLWGGQAILVGEAVQRKGTVDDERQLIANFSKSMASMCVRNTMLEDIHAGIEPVTHTGDFYDADGHRHHDRDHHDCVHEPE